MIFLKNFLIHPGLIVISLHKSRGDYLHKILISQVIFRQQDQMIIFVITCPAVLIKTAPGGHIDLAAYNRLYPLSFTLLVKINAAVHDPVIRDRRGRHSQLLYSGYIFFYFVRSIQKRVARVDVQVSKCHFSYFTLLF